jgi:hypothetical protein
MQQRAAGTDVQRGSKFHWPTWALTTFLYEYRDP